MKKLLLILGMITFLFSCENAQEKESQPIKITTKVQLPDSIATVDQLLDSLGLNYLDELDPLFFERLEELNLNIDKLNNDDEQRSILSDYMINRLELFPDGTHRPLMSPLPGADRYLTYPRLTPPELRNDKNNGVKERFRRVDLVKIITNKDNTVTAIDANGNPVQLEVLTEKELEQRREEFRKSHDLL